MKKRMLADVLWRAANRHLSPTATYNFKEKRDYFSCNAVWFACDAMRADMDAAHAFLTSLGCDCGSGFQLAHFADGQELQGIRYMWLLLAMHVAEDEGIEI